MSSLNQETTTYLLIVWTLKNCRRHSWKHHSYNQNRKKDRTHILRLFIPVLWFQHTSVWVLWVVSIAIYNSEEVLQFELSLFLQERFPLENKKLTSVKVQYQVTNLKWCLSNSLTIALQCSFLYYYESYRNDHSILWLIINWTRVSLRLAF